MVGRLWCGVVALAGLLGCSSVTGQQVPAAETGPRLVTSQLIDGQVLMRDANNGRVLIHNRGLTIYNPGDSLAPDVTMQEQPSGFDLLLNYRNTGAQRRGVGNIRLGVVTLGPDITYEDFRHNSADLPLNVQTITALGWNYPADLYSPVAVLRNGTYAIGISLQYPVIAYAHDAIITVASPRGAYMNGEGGQGWAVGFDVSGAPHGRAMQHPAVLEPGESRRYVLSVRVTRKPDQWVRTLAPYRDYFNWGYGGVRYELDPTPLLAINPADPTYISPTNPAGWGPDTRPDTYGWSRWTQKMNGPLGAWPGYMVWTPTGLYNQHTENNYPFQFTTRWRSNPRLMSALDSEDGFPSVRARGKRLGLWWGRSLQVAGQWNAATLTPLDPHNPAHVEAATAELDLAVRAGVSVIGLDSFSHDLMPIWEQVLWLKAMQAKAPGVKFVIEPSACDVMHRLAASFIDGWNFENVHTIDDLYKVKNPDALADFLLPGHETWVGMRWDGWRQFNATPTPTRIHNDIRRYAQYGYVPVVFQEPAYSAEFRASDTEPATIPPEIRTPRGAHAGIMTAPSVMNGGGAGAGGPTTHSGLPMNPLWAARLFSRSQLRLAIRSAMGLP
ncbi:MAG: hypothetical protein IT437_00800 [Phycisphaerales bacterium]|nr:hypothetical protein [Phycisphaerales bacterium]